MDVFQKLAAPFPAEQISWRVGSTNKKSQERTTGDKNAPATKGMALAYIDARDVMERFDDVVTPAGWQRRYSHADTKTICELGVKFDGDWLWKADGAGDSDIEAEKGAISDAFKRAAVNWGVGRYLYEIPSIWVAIDKFGQIEEAEKPKLAALLNKHAPVKPTQRPELSAEEKAAAALEHAHIHAEACRHDCARGSTHEEYYAANKDILTRIARYDDARTVLEQAGLTGS